MTTVGIRYIDPRTYALVRKVSAQSIDTQSALNPRWIKSLSTSGARSPRSVTNDCPPTLRHRHDHLQAHTRLQLLAQYGCHGQNMWYPGRHHRHLRCKPPLRRSLRRSCNTKWQSSATSEWQLCRVRSVAHEAPPPRHRKLIVRYNYKGNDRNLQNWDQSACVYAAFTRTAAFI